MNRHFHHSKPPRRESRGIGLWLSLLLGFLLAVIGLTLVNGRPGAAHHLLDDITVPAGAQQPARYAGSRDPSLPPADTVQFKAQDSDTAPAPTF
ncbi:MAG: hypothetical protein P4L96_01360 [Rhodoferax sp.]|nr:hypothetical protein [Rhodoferax sp.]